MGKTPRNPFAALASGPGDMDVCVCGDFRHQHVDGTGPSKLNWDNLKGVMGCVAFRPITTQEKR